LAVWAVGRFTSDSKTVQRSINRLAAHPEQAAPPVFRSMASTRGPLALTLAFTTGTVWRTAVMGDPWTAVLWLPVSFLVNLPLMTAVWVYLALLLQRLALSSDSAEAAQLGELRGSGPAYHRNGRASLAPDSRLRLDADGGRGVAAEDGGGDPAGAAGDPEDVGLATLFLAPDSASWLTGVTLDVAGGYVMT
jgi:hypothetical protein